MDTGAAEQPTQRWRPAPSAGGLLGVLGIVVSLLLAGGLFTAVAAVRPSALTAAVVLALGALLLAVAVGFAYLLWGYRSISYELGERELIVRWAHRRERIDLAAVTRVAPTDHGAQEPAGGWPRFWPGYYVGDRQTENGPVRVVATLPPERRVIVATDACRYAISPERSVLFMEECGRRQRWLGAAEADGRAPEPTGEPGAGAPQFKPGGRLASTPIVMPRRPTFDDEPTRATVDGPRADDVAVGPAPTTPAGAAARTPLLMDRVAAACLVAAVALNLALIGYIVARYASIPPSLALHWSASGVPDRIGARREIWTLPLISWLVVLANFGLAWSVDRFDRFAARFLLAAAALVQVVAWVAVASLIH